MEAGQLPSTNPATILMLKSAVALAPVLSVARAVNENEPAALGVPLNCPEVSSETPGGGDPPAIDQAYGGCPPLADNACEYAAPWVPSTKLAPVIVSGGAIVSEQLWGVREPL